MRDGHRDIDVLWHFRGCGSGGPGDNQVIRAHRCSMNGNSGKPNSCVVRTPGYEFPRPKHWMFGSLVTWSGLAVYYQSCDSGTEPRYRNHCVSDPVYRLGDRDLKKQINLSKSQGDCHSPMKSRGADTARHLVHRDSESA